VPENLLLDSQCKRARPHKKVYRLNDGGGLCLIVHPDARKYCNSVSVTTASNGCCRSVPIPRPRSGRP